MTMVDPEKRITIHEALTEYDYLIEGMNRLSIETGKRNPSMSYGTRYYSRS